MPKIGEILSEHCLTRVEDVAVAGARDDLSVVGAGQELGREYVGTVNGLHVLNDAPGHREIRIRKPIVL